MKTMELTLLLLGLGTTLLVSVVVFTLQQEAHRKSGLLPGPDPRGSNESLLDAVLGAVSIHRVRRGSVEFEDGSGVLFTEPDRHALDELSRLAAACEVCFDRVYELTQGWRFVFRGGNRETYVDVSAYHLVAPRVSTH